MAWPMALPLGQPLLHASWLLPSIIGIGLVAAYMLLVLVSPSHRCFGCHGKKHRIVRGKIKPCPDCRAHGRAFWPGARLVHRLFWRAIGNRMMDRRRARIGGE